MLTLLNPVLMYGAAAGAVPILIHLLLRRRARRQVFPALRLLQVAQFSTVQRRRLLHLLILAIRVAVLLLAVGALAGPVLRAGAGVSSLHGGPVDAVLCIDDSASMLYRFAGRTRLDNARLAARTLLYDDATLPDGSRYLVLCASQLGSSPPPGSSGAGLRASIASGAGLRARQTGRDADPTDATGRDAGPTEIASGAGLLARQTGRDADPTDATGRDAGPTELSGRDAGPTETAWTGSRSTAADRLSRAGLTLNDRPLRAMLDAARHALAGRASASTAPAGRGKAIYLFTDMTRRAFADVAPTATSDDAPPIFVIDVGQDERHNAAVSLRRTPLPGQPPEALHAAPGLPLVIPAVVSAGDEPIDGQVEFWLDGVIAARSDAVSCAPGQSRDVTVVAPPQPPGVRLGELRLNLGDSLPQDNVAFVAIDVAPRQPVAVVAPTRDPLAHDEARRIAALLAPPSLPPDRRPFDVRLLGADAILGAEVETCRFIALVEPTAPDERSIARIRALAEAGRTVLIVCGAQMRTAAWPNTRATLGAAPVAEAPATQPIDFASDPNATNTRNPAAAMTDHAVYRYVRLRPAADAAVALRFVNGDPAIIERACGRGRVIWWTFSLRNDWSDLGTRAAAILVRLHEAAAAAAPSALRAANLLCGESARLSLGPASAADGVVIERMTAGATEGKQSPVAADSPGQITFADDAAGLYRITASRAPTTGRRETLAGCAVNLHPDETDGLRMADDAVRAALHPHPVTLVRDPADLPRAAVATGVQRDLAAPLLAAAIALLALEMSLARRTVPVRGTASIAVPQARGTG